MGEQGEKQPGLSWRVHLLPYLGESALYERFHHDEPWDSPHNRELIPLMPNIFGDAPEGKTRLHVLTGEGAPFQMGRGIRFQEITDGLSNVLMAVEAGADRAEIWTKPGGLQFDPIRPLFCLGQPDLQEGGFNVVMMDGRARFLPVSIDPDLFHRLVQHADGRPVEGF